MPAKTTNNTTTKTIDGIEVTINPDILQDYDVLMQMLDINKPMPERDPDQSDEDYEKQCNQESVQKFLEVDAMANTIFGEKQFKNIRDELRKSQDPLTAKAVMDFVGHVFTAFAPKN